MIAVSPKIALRTGITAVVLIFCVVEVWIGEVDAEPKVEIAAVPQDLTVLNNPGSESSSTSTPEPIVDPVADHSPVIPLADAVITADGLGETMMLLNAEIKLKLRFQKPIYLLVYTLFQNSSSVT